MLSLVTWRSRVLFCLLIAASVCGLPALAGDDQGPQGLKAYLRSLAAERGIVLRGLERLQAAPPIEIPEGDPAARIRQLLRGYNYVMRHDGEGRITEIEIVGRRPTADALGRFAIPTSKIGSHHLVNATLAGPNGNRFQLQLIVDTGASSIVLPNSMIAELGFREQALRPGWAETAGGRKRSRIGELATVAVGHATRHRVTVVFLPDELIGGKALLGMSFLRHYQITIRSSDNILYLSER